MNWGSLLIGLGAILAGSGSVLSGIAALRSARRECLEAKPATTEAALETP